MRKRDYRIVDRVYSLLIGKFDTRDDDEHLFRMYWESLKVDFAQYRNYSLQYAMEQKLMDNYTTIVNCRKKLQSKCEYLRGDKYDDRQIMGGQKKKSQVEDINQLKFKFY